MEYAARKLIYMCRGVFFEVLGEKKEKKAAPQAPIDTPEGVGRGEGRWGEGKGGLEKCCVVSATLTTHDQRSRRIVVQLRRRHGAAGLSDA